jgi:hypothetical protein
MHAPVHGKDSYYYKENQANLAKLKVGAVVPWLMNITPAYAYLARDTAGDYYVRYPANEVASLIVGRVGDTDYIELTLEWLPVLMHYGATHGLSYHETTSLLGLFVPAETHNIRGHTRNAQYVITAIGSNGMVKVEHTIHGGSFEEEHPADEMIGLMDQIAGAIKFRKLQEQYDSKYARNTPQQ